MERSRVYIVITAVFIFVVIITLRLMNLAYRHPQPYQISSLKKRGTIYDRNMRKLAETLVSFSMYADPKKVKNIKKTARFISRVSGLDFKSTVKKLSSSKRFVWLKRQMLVPQALQISRRLKKEGITGIGFVEEYKRIYPFGRTASQIIGAVGIDGNGLSGLEYEFDRVLSGKNGISAGIVLTIDINIQRIAEEELEKTLKKVKADWGTIIVMDTRTGEILAAAVKPDFDPSNPSTLTGKALRNRLVTDAIEPGSVVKVITASILIENHLVNLNTWVPCRGKIKIKDTLIKCLVPHGYVNLEKVIIHSCNVGMAQFVKNLSAQKLYSYLVNLGFGEPVNIGLPGETKGILRNYKSWSAISKYMIAIGQEISATPIQLIKALSSIATTGYTLQPILIKYILDEEGNIIKAFKTSTKNVFSPETTKTVRKYMREAVEEGTGREALIEGINIAGKTGTGQIAKRKGGYYEDRVNATFFGVVPASRPKIAVLVIIHYPRVKKHTGGEVAAPLFRSFILRLSKYDPSIVKP